MKAISIPIEIVKQAIYYDPKTGQLTWKIRPQSHFPTFRAMMSWNARLAGKQAGCLNRKGYLEVSFFSRKLLAHRIAWVLAGEHLSDDAQIDHRNGMRCDNRFSNLRQCTRSQNICNTPARKDSLIGLKGVSKIKNRFKASITVNRKQKYLGCFLSPEEAHAAYCAAADKYHGEFSNHGTERSLINA